MLSNNRFNIYMSVQMHEYVLLFLVLAVNSDRFPI